MYVLAPPSAPYNIKLVIFRELVIVTWEVPKVPRVPLTFKVTLNISGDVMAVIQNKERWEFQMTEKTCGTYELEVEVSNIAGRDSTTVTGKLPEKCSLKEKDSVDYGLCLSFPLLLFTLIYDFIAM